MQANSLLSEPPGKVVQRVKRLHTMQETWVRSLGQEDPLEKELATHSSTLAWEIPWTEKPGGLQPMGLQRVRPNSATKQEDTWGKWAARQTNLRE